MKTGAVMMGLSALLSLFGCSHAKPPTALPPTKTVVYRGGVVRFDLPRQWREEYDPNGGGTFYDERPGSGTLRLDVISFGGGTSDPHKAAVGIVASAGDVELLPSGCAMGHRVVDADESGTALQLHRWEIAVPVPPSRARVVCFTHTILAEQAADPLTVAELAVVENAIRSATFSQEAGVAGPFTQ